MTVFGTTARSGLTCLIIPNNEIVAQNSAFDVVNCH
jgi:hypothetical protein